MGCQFLWWCEISPEAQAGWAQAIFTVAAFIWSIWLNQKNRKIDLTLQRQLNQPHLGFDLRTMEHSPQLEIILKNNGAGIARVTGFEVYLDGKPFDIQPLTRMSDVVNKLKLNAGGDIKVNGGGTMLSSGSVLSPGETRQMAFVTCETAGHIGTQEQILEQASRLRMVVKYQSLFGDAYSADTNEM